MKRYKLYKRTAKKRWRKVLLSSGFVLLVVLAGGFFVVRRSYINSLKPINAVSNVEHVVAISRGASLDEIATTLKKNNVIRADWAFKQYVLSRRLGDKLQAGTYRFTTSQSVQSIVDDMTAGKVAADLFTILPGQRLGQIRQAFIDAGFAATAVDEALKPDKYQEMPALAEKPSGANLEGYLYPDSYQKTADTLPETIVRAAIDEMGDALTPELKQKFAAKGLTTYQAITLASIVEREVNTQEDRAKAAQVFLKRLSIGMKLGSDVTACYGALLQGVMKPGDNCNNFVLYDSVYNTRIRTGLPPGPISNVSSSGLTAVANPTATDYLYFVAGDDGITYFSKTNEEHEALVQQHCKKLCQ